MKKVMMMAMMAFAATTAFAQDVVKQVNAAKSVDAALNIINPALSTLSAEDKAKVYNKVVDLAMDKINSIQQIQATNQITGKQEPYDTVGFNNAVVQAMKYGYECDKFDQQPNAKGKVKPKFRNANKTRLQSVRTNLINVGLDAYNSQDREKALELFSMYCDAPSNPLFEGVDFSKDQYQGQVAYYASLSAYQLKDYAASERYADLAMADTAVAKDAEEIKIFCLKENTKTAADSAKYLNVIKEMHAKDPKNERYFGLLMEYYGTPGHAAEMKQFVNDEIQRDPSNKMVWALKGEAEMNERNWEAAVASYKKSVAIDPDFIQVLFNIGICLNSQALEFKDQNADRMGRLTADNLEKFKAIMTESKDYLEKCKEKDPLHETVNWPYPLYQIYYILYGENDSRTQELKAITGM